MRYGLDQIDFEVGEDGGIQNYIDTLAECAAASNGFIVEMGIYRGTGSTVAFQRGLQNHPNPLQVSMDYDEKYLYWRPTVPWWHYLEADDRKPETVEKVKAIAGDRTPGIIYIDTNHDYEQMTAELANWGPYAAPDTLFLFHDTWLYGGYNEPMNRAIIEWADANGWLFEDWKKERHGLGRMTKR